MGKLGGRLKEKGLGTNVQAGEQTLFVPRTARLIRSGGQKKGKTPEGGDGRGNLEEGALL